MRGLSWPFAGRCGRAVAAREGCCDCLQIGIGELLLKRAKASTAVC
jgi:hypothetical protein